MSHRTTARFEIERRKALRELFTRERLCALWRSLVKNQMRRFEITDLHDYYDFNFAIEARADGIIERVLAGLYRADAPLIYRAEKKLGICRHLMIPTPSDALVFQLLSDVLYKSVIEAQPSKKVFYARDRHSLELPHEHKEASSYPWFILWPRFQKEIWNFSKSFPYLVATDLTNYFDRIGLRELRHVISSIVKTQEVYLDLLFSLIEDLSWRPDYLPTSHTGLPTINIEAPRLLAHALLFEVDAVLKEKTKDNFVRWMDDINFGVDDLRTAKTILSDINDVLKSRGLALNLSKTYLLTQKTAAEHFMIRENEKLTKLQKRAKFLKKQPAKSKMAAKVGGYLARHLKDAKAAAKDKITKRYLTVLTLLGEPAALEDMKWIYGSDPSLRAEVLAYLSSLPFSNSVADVMLELYDKTEQYDDVSRFAYASAVVRWSVPRSSVGQGFITEIATRLKNRSTPFEWLCWAHFLAKYGAPDVILRSVFDDRKLTKEPFMARQRAAIMTRCLAIDPKTVMKEWRQETTGGFADSASVAGNLLRASREPFPLRKSRMYPYLFPEKKQLPYPLAKFLLLCAVGFSDRSQGGEKKRAELSSHVSCPWYVHWLSSINSVWFS